MIDSICDICKKIINEYDDTANCPDCGKTYHLKCWVLSGNNCVDYSCRQKAQVRKENNNVTYDNDLNEQKTVRLHPVRLCSKCGSELFNDSSFCGKCGTPVSKSISPKKLCLGCGNPIDSNNSFCQICGKPTSNNALPQKKTNSNPPSKWLIPVVVGICAVVIIASISIILSVRGKISASENYDDEVTREHAVTTSSTTTTTTTSTTTVPTVDTDPIRDAYYTALVKASPYLFLRKAPSINSAAIGRVPDGSKITVLAETNSWAKIIWNGIEGWVSKTYIVQEVFDYSPAYICRAVVTPKEGLNLRADSNTSSKILICIPCGTTITVYDVRNGFAQTTYKGKTGWVSQRYIKEVY